MAMEHTFTIALPCLVADSDCDNECISSDNSDGNSEGNHSESENEVGYEAEIRSLVPWGDLVRSCIFHHYNLMFVNTSGKFHVIFPRMCGLSYAILRSELRHALN